MTDPWSNSAVSLGVQSGDKTSGSVMESHFMPFRFLLRDHCKGPYSSVIRTFDFVLRIDGDIYYWNKSGFDYVYVRPKQGYATADVFVPREVWETRDAGTIREYISTNLRDALVAILDRMAQRKIDVERERLVADVDSAIRQLRAEGIQK